VDGEQRLHPVHVQRVLGIGGLAQGQLAALQAEPAPAGTELRDAGLGEVGLELVVVAEGILDHVGDAAGRLAAAIRLQALPVEVMVPDLGGIVEDRLLGRLAAAGGRLDDLLERAVLQRIILEQLVQRVEIGGVVLAIVEPDGLRIDHGAQRIFGIGKGFHREWGTHNRLLFEFGLLGRRPLIIGSKTRKEMAGNGQFRNNRAAELVAGRGSGRMERQEITMTMRMPAAALALAPSVFAAPGRAEMLGHGAMVNSVAVAPDGRQLLSPSWDYTVRLWDLEKQAELR